MNHTSSAPSGGTIVLAPLSETRLDSRIVPILYKACNLEQMSWVLPSVQFVDFTRSFKKGCRELLRISHIDDSGS